MYRFAASIPRSALHNVVQSIDPGEELFLGKRVAIYIR